MASDCSAPVEHSQDDKYRQEKRSLLCFKLRLSALYHQRRARFFDVWDKAGTAYAVLGSTAAVSQLFKAYTIFGQPSEVAIGASVAIFSTLSLVGSFSSKARDHMSLAADFQKLLCEVQAAGDWPEPSLLDRWQSACTAIASREPAPMTALLQACENQLAIADGGPKVKLPLCNQMFMQYWDFEPIAAEPRSNG